MRKRARPWQTGVSDGDVTTREPPRPSSAPPPAGTARKSKRQGGDGGTDPGRKLDGRVQFTPWENPHPSARVPLARQACSNPPPFSPLFPTGQAGWKGRSRLRELRQAGGAITQQDKADAPHAPRSFPILWRLGRVVIISSLLLPPKQPPHSRVRMTANRQSVPWRFERTSVQISRASVLESNL